MKITSKQLKKLIREEFIAEDKRRTPINTKHALRSLESDLPGAQWDEIEGAKAGVTSFEGTISGANLVIDVTYNQRSRKRWTVSVLSEKATGSTPMGAYEDCIMRIQSSLEKALG